MNWKDISATVISDRARPLKAALVELGCGRVVEADDGDGAFALFAAGLKPDVVVVDWSGARFDGLQVARRIRRTPALGTVPIVMVAAHAEYGRVMAAREAGVSAFLLKPVSMGALAARLRRLLAPGPRALPGSVPHIRRIAAGRAWFSDVRQLRRRV